MNSARQNTAFSINKTLNVGGRLLSLDPPVVMGILNVTPDSFYDGGKFVDEKSILVQTEKMLSEGAAMIDVGGYSSRPGADVVPQDEELKRTGTAIRLIRKNFKDAILSVDTFRSLVAKAAIDEGATLINDISGGEQDKDMFTTVARLQVPYICMHMKGDPQTMNSLATYENLMKEILEYFHKKIDALQKLGVKDIIVDPGFGFAKTVEQNFELLNHFELLKMLGRPVLAGVSRKSMIWRTLEITPDEALSGTTALNTIALVKGASILRVHDVKEAMQVIALTKQLSPSPVEHIS